MSSIGFWVLFWATEAMLIALPLWYGQPTDFAHGGWLAVLWEILPPAIAAMIWLAGRKWYATFWLIPVSVVLVAANLEIFLWPSSSTTSLLGIFVPLWCLIVFGPAGLLVGKITRKLIEYRQKARTE